MHVDQKPVALVQKRVALVQNRVALAQNLSPAGQNTFAPSPLTTLGNFQASGPCSRHSGSQAEIVHLRFLFRVGFEDQSGKQRGTN